MTRLFKDSLAIGFVAAMAFAPAAMAQSPEAKTSQPKIVSRVLFGSCSRENRPVPIFKTLVAQKAPVFVFIGDNIYGDTEDMEVMRKKYETLRTKPGFETLREQSMVLATWDDHDYGVNDGGAEYAQRKASQKVFVDFWKDAADSPRRKRPGVYDSVMLGPAGKRIQILLLDTRYFRSPLVKAASRTGRRGPYGQNKDPQATMLGAAQWKWLKAELKKPAEVRIIASSIQVVAEGAQWEAWINLPLEKQRLYKLLADTKASGVVFISGDRHFAELSVTKDEAVGYPLFDLTSSGLNQKYPARTPSPNTYRAKERSYYLEENFGEIAVDWSKPDPAVSLIARGIAGEEKFRATIPLSKLQAK